MNHLNRHDALDDFFRGFFVRPVELGGQPEAPSVRIDVREQAGSYLVHAELPGMKKEDIHVHIDGPVVAISAERRQERDVKDGERVLRTERYVGKVARTFQLGQDVDETRSSAKYQDGVLELTLPKKQAAQTRRLTIE